jgi:hypothetical protein
MFKSHSIVSGFVHWVIAEVDDEPRRCAAQQFVAVEVRESDFGYLLVLEDHLLADLRFQTETIVPRLLSLEAGLGVLIGLEREGGGDICASRQGWADSIKFLATPFTILRVTKLCE